MLNFFFLGGGKGFNVECFFWGRGGFVVCVCVCVYVFFEKLCR